MNQLFQFLVDNKEWIFSGVGVAIISAILWTTRLCFKKYKKSHKYSKAYVQRNSINIGDSTISRNLVGGDLTLLEVITEVIDHHHDNLSNPNERFQVTLGRRHKFLREKILLLNPREMSDFYGFEKVSFLEDCESGIEEFPRDSIRYLTNTFFIQSKYLQEGKYPIFEKFDIISSKDDCKKFLVDGFCPKFLCDPDFNDTGFVYLTFYKKEQKIWRTISSNTVGSFHSNGGGAWNIYHFIYAMLDIHYDSYISFVDVDSKEWKRLGDGSWYNKGMCYSGMANHQASSMFDKWVRNAKESLEEQQ